jgi:hypothetical protein
VCAAWTRAAAAAFDGIVAVTMMASRLASCPARSATRTKGPAWNALHGCFEMKRIKLREAHSLDAACRHWAEKFSAACAAPRSAIITSRAPIGLAIRLLECP